MTMVPPFFSDVYVTFVQHYARFKLQHQALPKIPSVLTNLWNLGGVM